VREAQRTERFPLFPIPAEQDRGDAGIQARPCGFVKIRLKMRAVWLDCTGTLGFDVRACSVHDRHIEETSCRGDTTKNASI
jgi:hypothetical protein